MSSTFALKRPTTNPFGRTPTTSSFELLESRAMFSAAAIVSAAAAAAATTAVVTPTTGASGTTYEVGPAQAYRSLAQVPWQRLKAGDTVYIHWRDPAQGGAYREKINLSGQGTAAAPIRIVGVAGPAGQRPVLDGSGATTAATNTTSWVGTQARGLITITRAGTAHDYFAYKPRFITIDGLDLRNAHRDQTFTDNTGVTQAYARNAAAIFVERGEDITIRNCNVQGSGNGIFVASSDDSYYVGTSKKTPGDGSMSRRILIEGNDVHDNGVANSYLEHNSYIEAVGVVYRGNRFGHLAPGAKGSNIKDRSAGTVVEGNTVVGGGHLLDLVEPQESASITTRDPSFTRTLVRDNVLIQDGVEGMNKVVHYGGDSGATANYRAGTLLFDRNTVLFTAAQSKVYYSVLLRMDTHAQVAELTNNTVLRVRAAGQPASVALTQLRLVDRYGTARLGVNTVDAQYVLGGYLCEAQVSGLKNLRLAATFAAKGPTIADDSSLAQLLASLGGF